MGVIEGGGSSQGLLRNTPVTRHGVRVRRVEIAAQGGLTEGE